MIKTTSTPPRDRKRTKRTLDHIDTNLSGNLSVQALSKVAALSEFHFHRQFKQWTGLSVQQYVKSCRVRHASYKLAFRLDMTITGIALDCGYGSVEAFSRMFRQQTGISPSQFRAAPQWGRASMSNSARSSPVAYDVKLVDFPETPVARLDHYGDFHKLAENLQRFIAWRKAFRLPPSTSATYNVLYPPDPSDHPGVFRLGLCAATSRALAGNTEGITASTIPGGRCAFVQVIGDDEQIKYAVSFLAGEWLRDSGVRLRNTPPFIRRRNTYPDVPACQTVTDIYLPISD